MARMRTQPQICTAYSRSAFLRLHSNCLEVAAGLVRLQGGAPRMQLHRKVRCWAQPAK